MHDKEGVPLNFSMESCFSRDKIQALFFTNTPMTLKDPMEFYMGICFSPIEIEVIIYLDILLHLDLNWYSQIMFRLYLR